MRERVSDGRWIDGSADVQIGGLTGRLIGERTIWQDGADEVGGREGGLTCARVGRATSDLEVQSIGGRTDEWEGWRKDRSRL